MNPAHPGVPTLDLPSDPERRVWLAATAAASGVAVVATAFPLVSSFAPSERARAAGGPVEPELVKPAQAVAALLRILLRKKLVTEEELAEELSRR